MFKALCLSLALLPFFTLTYQEVVTSLDTSVVYRCVQRDGYPTTVADTTKGRIELIVWKRQHWGSIWTPQRRCKEVSKRFQKYNDNGSLKYLGTGKKNNYHIICVLEKTRNGYKCREDGILLTVESGEDPKKVMNNLFDFNRVSGGGLVRGDILDWEEYLENSPIIE
jgi:hypothetical protein